MTLGMTWSTRSKYGYDELPFAGQGQRPGIGKGGHGSRALDSYIEEKSVVVGGWREAVTFRGCEGALGSITSYNPPPTRTDLE